MVPTVCALPSAGVTDVCMAVTLTAAAAGEAPLAWLAVWALTPGGSLPALTLACNWVTLVAQRALWVAVTGLKRGGIQRVIQCHSIDYCLCFILKSETKHILNNNLTIYIRINFIPLEKRNVLKVFLCLSYIEPHQNCNLVDRIWSTSKLHHKIMWAHKHRINV